LLDLVSTRDSITALGPYRSLDPNALSLRARFEAARSRFTTVARASARTTRDLWILATMPALFAALAHWLTT
jgi:hypothetical protein